MSMVAELGPTFWTANQDVVVPELFLASSGNRTRFDPEVWALELEWAGPQTWLVITERPAAPSSPPIRAEPVNSPSNPGGRASLSVTELSPGTSA